MKKNIQKQKRTLCSHLNISTVQLCFGCACQKINEIAFNVHFSTLSVVPSTTDFWTLKWNFLLISSYFFFIRPVILLISMHIKHYKQFLLFFPINQQFQKRITFINCFIIFYIFLLLKIKITRHSLAKQDVHSASDLELKFLIMERKKTCHLCFILFYYFQ